MPDENFRPTHGLPPDSRTNVPPDWWSLLVRDDLPQGQADLGAVAGRRWARRRPRGHARPRRFAVAGPRARMLIADLALLAVVVALIVVGFGYATPHGLTAVLLGCVVLALLVLLGIQVARLTGRRRW